MHPPFTSSMDTTTSSKSLQDKEERVWHRREQERARCAVENAEQRGLRLYGKSESTTELDALYRVLRRGRACYSNDNSRTELDTLHRVLRRRRVCTLQQQRLTYGPYWPGFSLGTSPRAFSICCCIKLECLGGSFPHPTPQ